MARWFDGTPDDEDSGGSDSGGSDSAPANAAWDDASVTRPVRVIGTPDAPVLVPDAVPDHAPGDPGWVRAFAETTTAQREPLADGVEQLPGIDPEFWHGPARERFAETRDRLVEQWRAVRDVHDVVAEKVQTYNTFVHQLQHLWEADRGNTAALRHTVDLHQRTTEALAAELLARAAELDAVAAPAAPTTPEAEPPGEPSPAGPPPEPDQPDLDQADPGQPQPNDDPDLMTGQVTDDVQHHQPVVGPPDPSDAPASPSQRYQLTEKLGVQLLAGSRVLRIPWEGARR